MGLWGGMLLTFGIILALCITKSVDAMIVTGFIILAFLVKEE